jgi:anti-repressor protein
MTETLPKVFENHEFGQVRVITGQDNEPWFVAVDVCRILDLDNVTEALRGLDDDEKQGVSNPEGNPRAGIPHTFNIISESGLYYEPCYFSEPVDAVAAKEQP